MTKPSATGQPRPPGASVSPTPSLLTTFFDRPLPLYLSAALFRLIFLLYGLWQDANSPVKYTDIDYLVFTDAARFVSQGQSPMSERHTATPLSSPGSSSQPPTSGKVLFAIADLVAGWLLEKVLARSMDGPRARKFAAIWLLNPMVATISTRGSSEGLLGVLVMALLWAVLERRVTLAGLLLGFGVHFKIYPFIYAPAIIWWMDNERMNPNKTKPTKPPQSTSITTRIINFITPARIQLALISLATFSGLNIAMYLIYGPPFLQHTYLHHVTRIDHRHNFSPYNTQLYLSSSLPHVSSSSPPTFQIEKLAFLPQLLLSTILIPLVLAKKSLPTAMLAQTFAFVTFNKVCTSQYFLWYMVLLPLYLPQSNFLKNKRFGLAALVLWVVSQGLWLQQGFELEFLGKSTFLPGLWLASLGFFGVNCWILGVIIGDVGSQ
ncbi:PIG-M-domain-containing protein [Apiosordaria backusii]|uniref:GPI mannosyltransferase 1 n=1 Tax=Apiosordaria backusii TaxID=314023 RepID=A0AA40DV21_9PEZI|nr:PIG-M-domain-containing protein [Apiosordaria backusii]